MDGMKEQTLKDQPMTATLPEYVEVQIVDESPVVYSLGKDRNGADAYVSVVALDVSLLEMSALLEAKPGQRRFGRIMATPVSRKHYVRFCRDARDRIQGEIEDANWLKNQFNRNYKRVKIEA